MLQDTEKHLDSNSKMQVDFLSTKLLVEDVNVHICTCMLFVKPPLLPIRKYQSVNTEFVYFVVHFTESFSDIYTFVRTFTDNSVE